MNTLQVHSSGPLSHCWAPDNRLLVFPRPSDRKTIEASLHELRWGTSMGSNEFMRRLAKTSFDIFANLQRNADPDKYPSYSMQYRAALAVCSQEILQFLNSQSMDEAKSMYLVAQCELIRQLELVWHLAELVFIQAFPEGHLTYNLCGWFHVQYQDAANDARSFFDLANKSSVRGLGSQSRMEDDGRFWPAVLTLVLQARTHEAASLLALHSQANSRALRGIRQLLVAMPVVSVSRVKGQWSESGAAFSQAWQYWQSECRKRFTSGEFDHVGGTGDSASYIKLILSILSGNPTAWDDTLLTHPSGGLQAWYFRFVSFLFYTNPLIGIDDLGVQLDAWMKSRKHTMNAMNTDSLSLKVDSLLTSIFHLDIQSFIRSASEGLENWWFVTHFTNLLHLAYPDVLNDSKAYDEMLTKPEDLGMEVSSLLAPPAPRRAVPSLPDSFVIGYAESLAADFSLLSTALGYLDFVPASSARQSALILTHGSPLPTRGVNWLISQSASRALLDTTEQLARITARRVLPLVVRENTHRFETPLLPYIGCTAIGWAFMARDHRLVNRLAEIALTSDKGFSTDSRSPNVSTEIAEMAAVVLASCHNGAPGESNVSQRTLGSGDYPKLLLSPELAFLIRYAELQQCFTEQNTEGAVDLLIELLVTGSYSAGPISMDDASFSASHLSSRLRLRLLTEIRHLLGRHVMRRDQVELLIAALVDLRAELSESESFQKDESLSSTLNHLHVLLARELASSFLVSGNPPSLPMLDSPV